MIKRVKFLQYERAWCDFMVICGCSVSWKFYKRVRTISICVSIRIFTMSTVAKKYMEVRFDKNFFLNNRASFERE